ncbi:MAG: hypothetical protein ABIY51_15555 [Ferruginibacter sp.]
MRNMLLFFIVIGVLLMAATFVLCILVFHPTFTSIVIGLAVPFIIFLLIRKKLLQALKIDESEMGEDNLSTAIKKNENLGNINLDKPGQFNTSASHESSAGVTQNRDKLKDFFKTKSSKPGGQLKQNEFSMLVLKDRPVPFPIQRDSMICKSHAGEMGGSNYSIPYPDPFFLFRSRAFSNILKDFFHQNK